MSFPRDDMVGLLTVIMAFPDHTHSFFKSLVRQMQFPQGEFMFDFNG